MTQERFRQIALSMPEAEESSHMDHPDFRVRGKIFATLMYPDGDWGMVKLTPKQQGRIVKDHPKVFMPVKGGWGKRGCTQVRLDAATVPVLRSAMVTAWCNTAPKSLAAEKRPAGAD